MIAALGLLAGNFTYQTFTDHLWLVAAERSYFQGMAILGYYIFKRYIEGVKL